MKIPENKPAPYFKAKKRIFYANFITINLGLAARENLRRKINLPGKNAALRHKLLIFPIVPLTH